MIKDKILVYGAAGYMGKLIAREAKKKNISLVLAGHRDFQSEYPVRVFSLNEETQLLESLKDVKLLINLAGPFHKTNHLLVKACLKNGTHYLDIAGEAIELETVYTYHEEAQKAGIMLMPGAGFGVVPTDLVANLAKEKLPDAHQLKIAYVTLGGASRGTLKTVLRDIHKEGVQRIDGNYISAQPAFKAMDLLWGTKKYHLVYNPWRADLFSAYLSTGIPNIETYSNFPGFVVQMMHGKLLWLRDLILKRLLRFFPLGPSDKSLRSGKTYCYAEVTNSNGSKAYAGIEGPEAYLFTAQTLLTISDNIMRGNYKTGFQTPNLYGKTLLKEIAGIKIQ